MTSTGLFAANTGTCHADASCTIGDTSVELTMEGVKTFSWAKQDSKQGNKIVMTLCGASDDFNKQSWLNNATVLMRFTGDSLGRSSLVIKDPSVKGSLQGCSCTLMDQCASLTEQSFDPSKQYGNYLPVSLGEYNGQAMCSQVVLDQRLIDTLDAIHIKRTFFYMSNLGEMMPHIDGHFYTSNPYQGRVDDVEQCGSEGD